jgi:hypothetical protein
VFNQKRLTPILLVAMLFGAAPLAAQLLDDPMRPPSAISSKAIGEGTTKATTDDDGFQLSAIRITRDKRSATVNGKTVTVGDRIASARVLSIQASSVTLQQNGKNLTINLLPLSIKKPVEATQP